MKTRILALIAMFIGLFSLCSILTCVSYAQETSSALTTISAETPPNQPDILADFVTSIAAKYPIISSILLVIGLLRTLFKPLVSWYQSGVESTISKDDDAVLAAWKNSWWFKTVSWLLDFGASIKVK